MSRPELVFKDLRSCRIPCCLNRTLQGSIQQRVSQDQLHLAFRGLRSSKIRPCKIYTSSIIMAEAHRMSMNADLYPKLTLIANRGSPYSSAVSTNIGSYTGTSCHFIADASCVLDFLPAYGFWPDVATTSNDQALATTKMYVDSSGITTSSSVECNWDKLSDSYSDAEISYTVDSDCRLIASMPGPQAILKSGPDNSVTV